MKIYIKKLILVFCSILITFSAMLVACTSDNQKPDDKDSDISYGETIDGTIDDTNNGATDDEPTDGETIVLEDSSIKNGEPQSGYYCGYRSNKNEFNIDSVKLTFYYGSLYNARYNLNIIFGFYNHVSPTKTIKKISGKEFYSDEYAVKPNQVIIRYHHIEEITIPEEIFEFESGIVTFSLFEELLLPNSDVVSGMGSGVHIYYKKEGDKIFLSNKSF